MEKGPYGERIGGINGANGIFGPKVPGSPDPINESAVGIIADPIGFDPVLVAMADKLAEERGTDTTKKTDSSSSGDEATEEAKEGEEKPEEE